MDYLVTIAFQPCDARYGTLETIRVSGLSFEQAWHWMQRAYGYWGLVIKVAAA